MNGWVASAFLTGLCAGMIAGAWAQDRLDTKAVANGAIVLNGKPYLLTPVAPQAREAR